MLEKPVDSCDEQIGLLDRLFLQYMDSGCTVFIDWGLLLFICQKIMKMMYFILISNHLA